MGRRPLVAVMVVFTTVPRTGRGLVILAACGCEGMDGTVEANLCFERGIDVPNCGHWDLGTDVSPFFGARAKEGEGTKSWTPFDALGCALVCDCSFLGKSCVKKGRTADNKAASVLARLRLMRLAGNELSRVSATWTISTVDTLLSYPPNAEP